MNKKIIIGARGSKLSLSYAETVKKLFFSASNMDLATMVLFFRVNSDTQDLF